MPDPTDAASVPLPCFALRPLSNRPVWLTDIGVRPIDPVTGRFGPAAPMNFASIDPEPWALAFLADLDRAFEPDRARAAHRLAPAALAALAEARLDLAAAIAQGLDVVRTGDDDAGLAEARSSLRERLLASLAQGFSVAAVTRFTGEDGKALTLFAANEAHAPTAPVDILPGRPRIPAPLRAPQPPAIVGIEARGPSAPASLAEAVRWSYVLTLRCRPAAQDQLRIQPMAGGAASQAQAAPTSSELFSQLAQYASVAGDLRDLLDGLTAEPPGLAAIGALETWAGLARAVAEAWRTHARAAPAPVPTTGPEPPAYLLAFEADDEGDLTALRLTRTGRIEAFGWPDVVLSPAGGEPLTLIAGRTADDEGCRWPLAPGVVRALDPLGLEVIFAGLPAGSLEHVQTIVCLDRNVTSAHGPPMNPPFVYRGAPITTPPMTPSIVVNKVLDIGTWSDDPALGPLAAAIKTLFDGRPEGRTFGLTVSYDYVVVEGPPMITAGAPVLLVQQASSADLAEIVQRMIAWRNETNPSTDGASWQFFVTAPATDAEPGAAPLISLDSLFSPIAPQR